MDPDRPTPIPPPLEPDRGPYKPLIIKNARPDLLYASLREELENIRLTPTYRDIGITDDEKVIGFVNSPSTENPLVRTESRLQAMSIHGESAAEYNILTDGISPDEDIEKFNIETRFQMHNHTYVNDQQATDIVEALRREGHSARVVSNSVGNRWVIINTPIGACTLDIGRPSAEAEIQRLRTIVQESTYDSVRQGFQEKIDAIEREDNESIFSLRLPDHPGDRNETVAGLRIKSQKQFYQAVETARSLSESVASAIVGIMSGNKRYPELRMDWLSPEIVSGMAFSPSTEIVGKMGPTVEVESKVKKEHGLEKIVGLPDNTMRDLRRIVEVMKDPKKAAFMKAHGFKHSNGAVFWGLPGTGKSLAAEAVAEEAGCEREELKIDKYLTAYIHASARQLGDAIRAIKKRAAIFDKPIVVQIDEADTIITPVTQGMSQVSHRDASEIRAVLLREFAEPSNVFFVLTTNLDPTDPKQADPAIVRNERIGYLVAFGMPTPEGRKAIFAKEIAKRTSADLVWEAVNSEQLAVLTDGFSPADIQQALYDAVDTAYTPDATTVSVSQQNLSDAVESVRRRKQAEENIKKDRLGFQVPSSRNGT